jgi:hypothetical protein
MLKEVLIGGAAGAGIGYLVARNLLEKKYARLLDEEIERTKEFYGVYNGPEDPEFMEQAIKTAEAMTEYAGGETVVNPAKLADAVTASIAADQPEISVPKFGDVMAESTEKISRAYNKPGAPSIVEDQVRDIESNVAAAPLDPDARAPYLITFAEFDANETDYEQITVSFFAGDGIVIDEEDNVISPDRVEQIVGTDNLNKFGTNTDDPDMEPNVIYVRCERFQMDFEVTRSPGLHAVEVLGQEPPDPMRKTG